MLVPGKLNCFRDRAFGDLYRSRRRGRGERNFSCAVLLDQEEHDKAQVSEITYLGWVTGEMQNHLTGPPIFYLVLLKLS